MPPLIVILERCTPVLAIVIVGSLSAAVALLAHLALWRELILFVVVAAVGCARMAMAMRRANAMREQAAREQAARAKLRGALDHLQASDANAPSARHVGER